MSEKIKRKDFLKKLGLAAGAVAIAPVSGVANAFISDDEFLQLSSEKQEFLNTYTDWLQEFELFVAKQKEDFTNIENNKKLMELSEQANARKRTLNEYMTDGAFAAAFYSITENVRRSIS